MEIQNKDNKDNKNKNNTDNKILKIKSSNDIDINGRIYFIPDKYITTSNKYIPYEYQKLYKIICAMYLDSLITNKKIENISSINKNHINDAVSSSNKLIAYITTGKIYITNITLIEKEILEKIPESLFNKINPNIVEKIDV